jgi:hypothetical protein
MNIIFMKCMEIRVEQIREQIILQMAKIIGQIAEVYFTKFVVAYVTAIKLEFGEWFHWSQHIFSKALILLKNADS